MVLISPDNDVDFFVSQEITMDSLSHLAAELGNLLQAQNAQVTTAESCTGGGIA